MELRLNEQFLPRIRANFDRKPMAELAAIYARHDTAEWSPEAFQVIRDIFQERHLALPAILPAPPPAPRPIRSASVLGFGATLIGRRDFARDHTYVTTQWLILFFIPVFPFRSLRVRPLPRAPSKQPRFGPMIRNSYEVLEVTRPNSKQVLFVYGFAAFAISWYMALIATLAALKPASGIFFVLGFALPYVIPGLMRYFAKRRAGL